MLRLWRHLLWFTWSSIYMSILEGKSYNYVALMAEKPNNHKGETKVPHSDSDISEHSS